jgi:sigma-E factor negative regulatory protein RseC
MIKETGKVVAVEAGGVWVETIQQSACNTCAAEKGCGQRLLAKATGKTTAIKVLPGDYGLKNIGVDDQVVIGIPEKVIVNGTMLTYFLPLLLMVLGVIFVSKLSDSDVVVALGALAGLIAGGLVVRLHSYLNRANHDVQPILLGAMSSTPLHLKIAT